MPIHAICFTPCGGYADDDEIGLIFHSMEQLEQFLHERSNQDGFLYDPATGTPQTSRFAAVRVPPLLQQAFVLASKLVSREPIIMADFYPGWMPKGTPPEIEAMMQKLPSSTLKGYYGSSYDSRGLVWLCWRDGTHDHALFVSSQEGMREAIETVPVPASPNRQELLTNAQHHLPPTSRWKNVELIGPMASLLVVQMRRMYMQAGRQTVH